MDNNRPQPPASHAWLFFILALAWSWLFWIPLIPLKLVFNTMPGVILYATGGLGPLLSAIYLLRTTRGQDERREFWRRLIDYKRVPWPWLLASLLIPVLVALASVLASRLLLPDEFARWAPMWPLVQNPLLFMAFLLSTLLFGPLPEEIGWRGYGLDSLQARYSPARSSLITGLFWIAWHLPLFLTRDSAFAALYPLFSPGFWLWALSLLSISVIMTWIFNHAQRSTLTAVLFHFSMSAASGFFSFKSGMQSLMLIGFVLPGVIVLLTWGLSPRGRAGTPARLHRPSEGSRL